MSSIQLSSRDRSLASLAAAVAVVTIAQQVAGKATRDALFLSQFDAAKLPLVMGASALLAVVVVLSVSRVLARFSPARAVPFFFLAHGGFYAAEWLLAPTEPAIVGVLVYLHTASAGAAVVSTFWSIVNESFDPHAAKAAIGRIAAGATAGGVVGGLGVWQLSQAAGVRSLLLALAVANLLVAVGLIAFSRQAAGAAPKSDATDTDAEPSGIKAVLAERYLRILIAIVALSAFADTAIDYVFKAAAASAYAGSDGTELAAFFSLFHTVVGVSTFVVQMVFVKRFLTRFGIAATAATLPGAIVTVGVGAVLAPALAVITALRGVAMSIENSLFRSAYELTYTPVPPVLKRPAKTVIDVGSDKIAAALASALILGVVSVAPAIAERLLLVVGVAAAGLLLLVIAPLHRGYVRVLADGLRSGAIELDDLDEPDLTTRQTMADTVSLSRSKLLEEIAARRGSSVPTETSERRERAIAAAEGDGELEPDDVAGLIELLAESAHLSVTVARLRSAPELVVEPLLERMKTRRGSPVIRRRIPRVLRAFARQDVLDGLLAALEDPVYEVRYRAAVALLSLTARHPGLEVDAERVFSIASAELDAQHRDRPILRDTDLDDASPFDDEGAKVLGKRLTYVFTLLALVIEREPLHLSFCALASSNKQLRGTGLEYLDSVLPAGLRRRLNPYLAVEEVASQAARPRQHIVSELMRSKDSLAFDRGQLLALLKPKD